MIHHENSTEYNNRKKNNIIKEYTYFDKGIKKAVLTIYDNGVIKLTIKKRGVTTSSKTNFTEDINILEHNFKYYIKSFLFEKINTDTMLRRLVVLSS